MTCNPQALSPDLLLNCLCRPLLSNQFSACAEFILCPILSDVYRVRSFRHYMCTGRVLDPWYLSKKMFSTFTQAFRILIYTSIF